MPFAMGAALAIIGGPIGLFCTLFAHNLAQHEPGYALTSAIGMSLLPIALMTAIAVALPFTTLLLPAVYYLTRSRLDVTPLRYAIVGAGLAMSLILPELLGRVFSAPRVSLSPLIEQQMRFVSLGMNVGTLLAGVVCGSLFAVQVRGHYERFQAAKRASAAG